MKNAVIIKGNRYGISIVLDKEMVFDDLLKELTDKLEKAERFFDSDKQLAVTFEGRTLSNEEMDQVLSVIQQNSKLNIQYVMEENTDLETTFYDIIQEAGNSKAPTSESEKDLEKEEPEEDIRLSDMLNSEIHGATPVSEDNTGLFYKGTLRSGQTLETKDSYINDLFQSDSLNESAKYIFNNTNRLSYIERLYLFGIIKKSKFLFSIAEFYSIIYSFGANLYHRTLR